MDIKYKTLTKLTEEEIQKARRPKSTHTYGNEWRIWAWKIGQELDGLDEASAKRIFEGLKHQYQVVEVELKKERIRKLVGSLEQTVPQKAVQKLVTKSAEKLFDMTGIIYVPRECEYLTEEVLKPYMDRVTILHMHTDVKFIDGKALKKCRKLEKVDFGFVEGAYNLYYSADGNQVIDRKTKERLWP